MTARDPVAVHDFHAERLDAALEFLKRTRSELRSLLRVRVWTDRFCVYDVNKDFFEIHGVGYPDESIVPLLRAINTAFKPDLIHTPLIHTPLIQTPLIQTPTARPYKEFKTGRRHPWAVDRVM